MPDSRPRIAILGGGPVGLEAALAARHRGFPFTVYEAAPGVGGNVRRWGHVRLFTPWKDSASPRMKRVLGHVGHPRPDPEARPTGRELVQDLLEPVAELPDIAPNLRTSTRVLAVGRRGMVKSDAIGSPERGREPFRILLADRSGREWTEEADVVLDCTGTYGNPNPLGDGGVPAPGERSAGDRIMREIPDVDGAADAWAGERVLLVGAGHSAQTAARALCGDGRRGEDADVIWAVRAEDPDWGAVPDDPLPARAELTAAARNLAFGGTSDLELRTGVVVDSVEPTADGIAATLRPRFGTTAEETLEVDRILGLTGSVGDPTLYRQLQVHECYATSGPMKLAAALLQDDSTDCLEQTSHGPEALTNPEPGFFLLGEKSYGRNNTFLMRVGWEQVSEVFQHLEDRPR